MKAAMFTVRVQEHDAKCFLDEFRKKLIIYNL